MFNTSDDKEEFYSRFSDQLSHSQSWPGIYLFKFIVKSESDNLSKLKSIFLEKDAMFNEKKSAKKKFTSLSVKVNLNSPEDVIEIYKTCSKLRNYCSLILINIVCNSTDFTNLQFIILLLNNSFTIT